MSYAFDILSRAWVLLSQGLPAEKRDGEVAMRFGLLLEELHDANHRLKDAVNHDARVTADARRLDAALTEAALHAAAPIEQQGQIACLGAEWTVPAPDPVLADASFCIAVTGEGAIARVVHGGWLQMLTAFAAELWTDGDPENGPGEWAEWLKQLQDMDEWSNDEMRRPFSFSSELGETAHVSIYRLTAEVAHG